MPDLDTPLTATLIELMGLAGPTGQEEPVLAWCREHWAALGATVSSTPIGNVIARIPGEGPKLLIQGHADEIGFVVKSIDANGFVWLTDGQAGNRKLAQRFPVGQPALIVGREKHVPGLFASACGHILATRADADRQLGENDIFVDIGGSG